MLRIAVEVADSTDFAVILATRLICLDADPLSVRELRLPQEANGARHATTAHRVAGP
jgi:hypothetical protein